MREQTQVVQPRLFTIPSAAQYAGVSPRTIEGYIETGQLHTYRLPARGDETSYLKKTLIEREELDRFIERGVRI